MGGMIKNLFGSKGTPAQSNMPDWLGNASQDLVNRATAISNTPYTPYTGNRVAPLTTNQNFAIQNAQAGLGRFKDTYGNIQDLISRSATPYGQTYNPNMLATSANPQSITGRDFTGADINAYMNPYVSAALQPQLDDLREQREMEVNNMNGRAGSSGNFGGSRAALAEDLARRRYDRNINDVNAQGYNTAFNNASNLFTSDANRNLQAQQSQADIYNQDINRKLQADTQNEQNRANAFNTNYGVFKDNNNSALNASNALQNLVGLQRNVSTQTNDDLLRTGALQQGQTQKGLDVDYSNFLEQRNYPKDMVTWLSGILNQSPAKGSIKEAATPGDDGMGNFLSTAANVASAFMGSDLRIKDKIVKVDRKDGINVYEFSYKGLPGRYRGVIAQEVENIPDAVVEKGNIKMVDYSKLPVKFEKVS
jgi:hypothetical protein